MIEPGETAPGFTLPDQDGSPVSLASHRGRWVVLYFYPKADTPGCTAQACGVRDHSADYEAADATVLGVSPDPVPELRDFADKYGLSFRLLSDEGHEVAELYGVWAEVKVGDRLLWGNQRSTVLIDPEGKVARVLERVDARRHDELALGALAELRVGQQA
jgi:thioredoxin-dependent peroxiredoxin